jgi:DNA-binding MarR family transcriptional regulator
MLSIYDQHTEFQEGAACWAPARTWTAVPLSDWPDAYGGRPGRRTLRGEMSTSDLDTAGSAAEWSLGRLLSMAARLVEQEWNCWLAGQDLTHAGLMALHALRAGPQAQRELAAASMVEEQTMSRVLDRLERAGYVTRQRDTADRRRLVVRCTAAGEQAYRGAIDADVANTIVTSRLDEPEAFRRQLVRLIVGLLTARGESIPESLLAVSAERGTDPR